MEIRERLCGYKVMEDCCLVPYLGCLILPELFHVVRVGSTRYHGQLVGCAADVRNSAQWKTHRELKIGKYKTWHESGPFTKYHRIA